MNKTDIFKHVCMAKVIGEEKAAEFVNIYGQLTRNEKNHLDAESKSMLFAFISTVVEDSEALPEKKVWKAWADLRRKSMKIASKLEDQS